MQRVLSFGGNAYGGGSGIRTQGTLSRLINYLSVILAPHYILDPHSDPHLDSLEGYYHTQVAGL